MPTLYETVKRFFDATDWAYEELGDDMLMTTFGGERGEWHCVAQTSDDTRGHPVDRRCASRPAQAITSRATSAPAPARACRCPG